MKKLLDSYNTELQAIYDHVGFTEDWVIAPIDDCTDKFWEVDGDGVKYADSMEDMNSDGNYYEDEIWKQRFYTQHVYKGKDLTMIFCDPHVDGMKWFRVFDNSKQIK